jgi:hypothetical protein
MWGSLEDTKTITINGMTVTVGKNLAAALDCLRSSPMDKVWIDAICINQDDIDEIAEVLRRAEGLKKRRACREAAVLRITAYALMEVAIVASLFIALISAGRIASTLWSCEKMGKLVSLFYPLLVLGYGKFALVEGSRLAAIFHV